MSDQDNVVTLPQAPAKARGGLIEDYLGCTISLEERYWRFVASGPVLHEEVSCRTLADAREAIDKAVKLANRVTREAIPMQLPLLTEDGTPFICKGIHTGTQAMLGLPKDKASSYAAYPDVPAMRAILRKATALRQESADLTQQAAKAFIRTSRGYGRMTDADDYPKRMSALQAAYDKAHAVAITLQAPDQDQDK